MSIMTIAQNNHNQIDPCLRFFHDQMIARASGKHSREKLIVFVYGLMAAGLEELSGRCQEALAHLGTPVQ